MKSFMFLKNKIKTVICLINSMCDFVYGEEKGTGSYYKNTVFICCAGLFASLLAVITGNGAAACIVIFTVWEAGGIAAQYYLLKNKVGKKKTLISLELPDFEDRTALLIDAGMQLKKAIIMAAEGSDDIFSAEIRKAFEESGRMENVEENAFSALEKLARKCEIPSVNTFVSVITRNMKKGSDTVCEMLRIQAEMSRNERKNTIKRLGEETATYMLIPSFMIFIAIVAMMITPAVIMLV